jgi:hypothetical protein
MIFLSASIPDPKRNPKYFDTADIFAIRDAIRAVATVVIPKSHLVWGGHPAITPLIRYVLTSMHVKIQDHITLYQSEYFRKDFPDDNRYIENIVFVDKGIDRDDSLKILREKMLSSHTFTAGIFIGGMEGVEEEYELFTRYHPNALKLPIASTGSAARFIFERDSASNNESLLKDYAYMALFKSVLKDQLR